MNLVRYYPRFPCILLLRAHLSLGLRWIWICSQQKDRPFDVIRQIHAADFPLGSLDSDGSDCNTAHKSGHVSENVLNPRADFCFFSVGRFLFISQRCVSVSLFANVQNDIRIFFHNSRDMFLACVSTVKPCFLVVRVNDTFKLVHVVNIRARYGKINNDFAFLWQSLKKGQARKGMTEKIRFSMLEKSC